jgi:outer membrane protein
MKIRFMKTSMINHRARRLAFLGMLLLSCSAMVSWAQTVAETPEPTMPMSLEECITYALDHNIDIKKQLLIVENQKQSLLQSKLGLLPSLNAGATHGYNWGKTVDRYTNQFATTRVQSNNFYLSSNMALFQGLTQVNTIQQNQLNLMATQYDLDLIMDNISIAVSGYYLDILYNQEILEVSKAQLDITTQQVNRMKKMLDAGTIAKGDLLSIQAQAATEDLAVVNAENTLAISYLTMQQLIDYPVSNDFRIEKPELRPIQAPQISITPEDIYNVALGARPEIKSAEYRVQSAHKGVAIAQGYQSPTLNLSGTWATGYSGAAQQGYDTISGIAPIGYVETTLQPVVAPYEYPSQYETIPFQDQLNNNQNKSIGLTLQVPIYNGWQVRSAISKAKLAEEEAKYSLNQAQLDLNKTIQQAYADAIAALKNFNAAETKVSAQQEAFKYAQQKFEVGLMNAVDYNEIKKNLTTAESELLQSKYRYLYTTTVLRFYMGKPLTFNAE